MQPRHSAGTHGYKRIDGPIQLLNLSHTQTFVKLLFNNTKTIRELKTHTAIFTESGEFYISGYALCRTYLY